MLCRVFNEESAAALLSQNMTDCLSVQLDGSGMPTVVPTEVALVCLRQQAPKPGQEVTINYGDKGNEMLLMSYGRCCGPSLSAPMHCLSGCCSYSGN